MDKKSWLVILVLAAVAVGACNMGINVSQGSGNVISETRTVSGFDRLELNGIGDVQLTQGDTESLEIEAEDNIITNIQSEVKDGTLIISYDNKTVIPTETVRFKITMKDIHGLKSSGVSNIEADTVQTDTLTVEIGGTGNINIADLTADNLTVEVSGAGNLTVEGTVGSQNITLTGAGNYTGDDLESANATVNITGIGRVVVWVTDTLDVNISGGGGVDYYGTPDVKENISGVGKLTPKGDK